MSFTLRIFLAYFLIIAVGLVLALYNTHDELRPLVRQTSEETLVDTANVLAEFATPLLVKGTTDGSAEAFRQAISRYRQRHLDAQIWSRLKTAPALSVYVTNRQGIVVFATDADKIGQDYSRWHDVARTLAGHYGARTTGTPGHMFVAAPVRHHGNLVGVLTVGLPVRSLRPWVADAGNRMLVSGAIILAMALLLGAILAYWLTRSVRRLVTYVENVRDGTDAPPPRLRSPELARLADSTEQMRREIEGKRYVEQYVQHLTHEMKSPLSAVHAAVEILQEAKLDERQRRHFLSNIDQESRRMQRLIDRLLDLATLENRHELIAPQAIDLAKLVGDQIRHKETMARQRNVQVDLTIRAVDTTVRGEAFLLQQAVSNLLDNALDFCPAEGRIDVTIDASGGHLVLNVENDGMPIPDYALPRLFERFYSLNRPATGRKSTGLGLSFVREIAKLHHGRITLENTPHGVRACLTFPAA